MNRREFNIRVAALGLAPLAPQTAAARGSAALSGLAAMHYPWAARYARVHDACSPEKLARAFRLPPDIADELFARLQADGVITAPGLSGLARAVDPIDWDIRFSGSSAQRLRSALSRRLQAARRRYPANPPEADLPRVSATAKETESEGSPADQPTGSAESPPS